MISRNSGEALRDTGAALADNQSKAKSIIMRLTILDLAIKGEPFTADDLPDEDKHRSNRTGSSFLALSRKGLIVFTGQCGRSVRPCRHAGFSRIWQAPDVSRCHAEAIRLLGELQLLEPVSRQGGLFPDSPQGEAHGR